MQKQFVKWPDVLNELQAGMTKQAFDGNLRGSVAYVDDNGRLLRVIAANKLASDRLNFPRFGFPQRIRTAVNIHCPPCPDEIVITGPDPDLELDIIKPVNGDGTGERGGLAEITRAAGAAPSRGGNVQIALVSTEPTKGYIAIPHYAGRFWRPLLGNVPFSLWEVLRSYAYAVSIGHVWPSIEQIVDTMGSGVSRASILGRAETRTRPHQTGAIEHLQAFNVIRATVTGEAGQTRYSFRVLDDLPLLSPSQVALLPEKKQAEHGEYLGRYKAFNYEAWAEIQAGSLIPGEWWQ